MEINYKLKNKFIQGYANGLLFATFLGLSQGPFQEYSTEITKQQLRTNYFKYVRTTMIKFPMLTAIYQFTIAALEQQGYSTPIQMSCGFVVGLAYLQIVRYK